MSRPKPLSDMQHIANAFHFTKQDLMLNRELELSESQSSRMWRRFWTALVLMIVIFGIGGVILAVFLWGTAPEGTFTFLPSNAAVSDGTDNDQLFFFGVVLSALFLIILIFAIFGMIGFSINIQRGEIHIYRGMIQLREGYDDYYLKLLDDGRSFDINHDQYNILKPLVDERQFAVYYVKSREGIVSLETI